MLGMVLELTSGWVRGREERGAVNMSLEAISVSIAVVAGFAQLFSP